ncbi:Outer membrane efflux protein [Desulfonatronum thiosulfatophilum]|uniref:Outer membrane efflux protein n=1 Tax=Desulfonatronum thiosulfatophilum TaxID=617002 RepID=A0A1G6DPK4_9BACT|nr:efflux transporter outer membrane subunit [Desulfonatronum thiosulfatophilum]SDB47137.1 Outer membrane efflux protein [Desulfonatronum thiosulfatophilum]
MLRLTCWLPPSSATLANLLPAALLLLAALHLTGCAAHTPRTVQPPPGMPSAFAGDVTEATALPGMTHWWNAFDDHRLDALMQELFSGNMDLRAATSRLERAQAAADVAGAARSPGLNLEGAGGRQRQALPLGPQTDDAYRLSAAAAYELDLWGRLSSREQAATTDAQAAAEDVRALRVSLSATLVDLYHLAAEAQAQLELNDRAASHAHNSLELTRNRYREGLVPLLDVHQAQQNLARIRAQRPTHEARLTQSRNALDVLLGRYPGEQPSISIPALPVPPDIFAAGLPSELLTTRPDIRAAQHRLQAADARVAAAVADRFPTFSLTAVYGGASTDLGALLASSNIFWNLLLNAAQPLLDGGRREAQVRVSEAEFQELLARYHQAVLQAFAEVEDALTANETTARRVLLLEDHRTAAQRTLDTALWRYQHGLNDYLPVLQAQTVLTDTESALLTARRQILADRVQLARALGGAF